jgi:predicted MFS family arabinose efflux permease
MPDKRLIFILPCAFVVSLAVGIVNLGMLFLIKESYGAGPAVVGWFTALWAGAYFLGCIAFRPLSRRIDAATSTVLMGIFSAAFLAAQFAAPSLAGAFLASTLYGLACALIWPRLMGWLASGLEGNALSRASGSYSLSWSTGMTLSPYIAGILSERDLKLPIYVGIALFAATGVFMLAARRIAPSPRGDSVARSRTGAEDRSTPLRYPAWIGLFAVYILYSVFNNIFPLYAKDELAMSESGIGFFLLIRAAAMAAGFWVIGRMRFWQFKPVYLPLALASTFALALSFIFVRAPLGFAVGLVLLGVAQAFAYSLSIFYGASGAPDRDKRMSVHEAVLTAGQIVGSVGGGSAYQGISWPIVFVFVAAIALLCMPLQVALARKR